MLWEVTVYVTILDSLQKYQFSGLPKQKHPSIQIERCFDLMIVLKTISRLQQTSTFCFRLRC
jgi:hypothetical protein